jgi:hypothetical protein
MGLIGLAQPDCVKGAVYAKLKVMVLESNAIKSL